MNHNNTITFSDLLKEYENESYIPYAQYLKTEYWKSKRIEILSRDHFRCRQCDGYETKTNKKTQTIKWIDTEVIIWSDYNSGEERFSELIKPESEPDKAYNLQIHHLKYIKNRFPWEYDNDDLMTLCNYCHFETHENTDIPVFDEKGNQIMGYEKCDRCLGTGVLDIYQHVQGGVCFKCNGNRYNTILIDRKLIK